MTDSGRPAAGNGAADDAMRLFERSAGCRVVQINAGAGCHLDAEMFAGGLRRRTRAPQE